MTKNPITLIDACNDRHLFADWFRDREPWAAWFAFIAALFGSPMTPERRDLLRGHRTRYCANDRSAGRLADCRAQGRKELHFGIDRSVPRLLS